MAKTLRTALFLGALLGTVLVAAMLATPVRAAAPDLLAHIPAHDEFQLNTVACGVASATMILDYYQDPGGGADLRLADVRQYVTCPDGVGTNTLQLETGLRQASEDASLYAGPTLAVEDWKTADASTWFSVLKAELDAKRPVVIFLSNYLDLGWTGQPMGHFVVVSGYNDDGTVIWHDPIDGKAHTFPVPGGHPAATFGAAWGGQSAGNPGYLYMVVSRSSAQPQPAPTVTALSPKNGPVSGGTSVVISGSGFTGASAVTFGGTAAVSYHVDSDTQITATAPAEAAGIVQVNVVTAGGATTRTGADDFAYIAPPATTRYDQTDDHIAYSGNWVTFTPTASPGAYGGTYARANVGGSSATIYFTGTQLDWIGMKGTTTGTADVYLDAVFVTTVDLAATAATYQVDVWSTGTLASGPHNVRISWSTGNAAGKYITLDAVDIAGSIAQGPSNPQASSEGNGSSSMPNSDPAAVARQYMLAVGQGDLNTCLALLHPDSPAYAELQSSLGSMQQLLSNAEYHLDLQEARTLDQSGDSAHVLCRATITIRVSAGSPEQTQQWSHILYLVMYQGAWRIWSQQ